MFLMQGKIIKGSLLQRHSNMFYFVFNYLNYESPFQPMWWKKDPVSSENFEKLKIMIMKTI